MIGQLTNSTYLAYGLMVISPAMFCANMIMARAMVGILPPITMAFLRWGLVAAFIAVILWPQIKIYLGSLRSEWRSLMFLGGLGMGLCGAPVYIAGAYTTATNIGLIYSTSPLLILLMSVVVLHQKLKISQLIGLLMGLCGVVLVLVRGDIDILLQLKLNKGDLWICMSTIAFSVYSLGLKYIPTNLPSLVRLAAMAGAGALWHLPFMLIELTVWGADLQPSWAAAQGVMILVFIASLGAYATYGKIVDLVGAPRASLVLYIVPLYAAGLALVLLGEMVHSYHILGITLILPGLWLANQAGQDTKSDYDKP